MLRGIRPDSWHQDRMANMIPKEERSSQIVFFIYITY